MTPKKTSLLSLVKKKADETSALKEQRQKLVDKISASQQKLAQAVKKQAETQPRTPKTYNNITRRMWFSKR